MSLQAILPQLNPVVGKITTINIKYSGLLRGAQPTSIPSNCIYIARTGMAQVNGSLSPSVTVMIEGGTAAWDGALKMDYCGTHTTDAQDRTLWQIIRYIQSMTSNVEIVRE